MESPHITAKSGDKTFADCYIVEVFCGKGGLSKALRRKGFQVFSVDHKAAKGVPVLMIDLNSPTQCKIFEELLAQGRLLYVHFAPPYGTASLARCIKLLNRKGPEPLRSLRYPMGLPTLTIASRERVGKANRLYQLTVKYIFKLAERDVGWSVENPSSSLMWITTPFVQLMDKLGAKCLGVCFHNCMFGSRRQKVTALWTSIIELQQLAKQCDDSHVHDPWGLTSDGSFATAQECAYDPVLCAHWAEAIAQYAVRMGYNAPPATLDTVAPDHLHVKDMANRAVLGALPRGNRLPPLLTDFLRVQIVTLSQHPFLQHIQPGARLPDKKHFSKGARLLRFLNDQQGVEIGMPVEPMAYIEQACKLVHPNMQPVRLPEGMERAISLHGLGFSVELRRVRLAWTKSMVSLYNQCKGVEEAVSSTRPEHMRSVLSGKRFELMRLSLEAVGYPDLAIAQEASNGLPLVGWMNPSGLFASKMRPPELHVDSLIKMAASFSKRSIASVQPSRDNELDTEVWKATLAEVEGGTLEGPFDLEDLPAGHVVSPRFGFKQGAKVHRQHNCFGHQRYSGPPGASSGGHHR